MEKISWRRVRKTLVGFAIFGVVTMLLSSMHAAAATNPPSIVIDVTNLQNADYDWNTSQQENLKFININGSVTLSLKFWVPSSASAWYNFSPIGYQSGTMIPGLYNYFILTLNQTYNNINATFYAVAGMTFNVIKLKPSEPFSITDDCVIHGTTYPGRFNGSALAANMTYHPMEASFTISSAMSHKMALQTDTEMSFFTTTNGSISIYDVVKDPSISEPNFPIIVPLGSEGICVRSLDPAKFTLSISTDLTGANTWAPDTTYDWLGSRNVRLTDAPGNSTKPKIAIGNPGDVHVVWLDQRAGGTVVYYKRSTDFGNTWSDDTNLSSMGSVCSSVAIACDGDHVAVAWVQLVKIVNPYPHYDPMIFVKESFDAGATWHFLATSLATGLRPSVAVESSNVYVVYEKIEGGGNVPHVYLEGLWLAWSEAGGMASETILFTESHAQHLVPKIVTDNGTLHVIWAGYFDDGSNHIYYLCRPNGSTIWQNNQTLADYYGENDPYAILFRGANNNLYLVWSAREDTGNGPYQLYYIYSNDSALTWSSIFQVTNLTCNALTPSMAVDSNGTNHICWTSNQGEEHIATYKFRSPTGAISTNMVITDVPGDSAYPDIIMDSNDKFHIVWEDYRHGEAEIYYLDPGSPRMTVTSASVLSELLAPASGESVTLSATFSNNGDGALLHSYVNFYVMSDTQLVASIPVKYFAPHSTMTFTTPWKATPGNHTMIAAIDSDTILENGYFAEMEKEFFVNQPPSASIDVYQNFNITAQIKSGDATISCTLLEDWTPISNFTLNSTDELSMCFQKHLGRTYALNASISASKKTNVNLKIRLSIGDDKKTIERTYHFSSAGVQSDSILLDDKLEDLSLHNPTFTFDARGSTDPDDGIRTTLWEIVERTDDDGCGHGHDHGCGHGGDGDSRKSNGGISLSPIFNYTFSHDGTHNISLTVADWHGLVDYTEITSSTSDGEEHNRSQEVKDYRSWGIDRAGVAHAVGISVQENHDGDHDEHHDAGDIVYTNNSAVKTEWGAEQVLVEDSTFPDIHVNRSTGILYVAWVNQEHCKKRIYLTSSADGLTWKEPRLIATLDHVEITDMRIEMHPEFLRLVLAHLSGESYFDVRVDFDNDGIIDQSDAAPSAFNLIGDASIAGDAANSTADGKVAVIVDYTDDNKTMPSITEVTPPVPLANSIDKYYEIETPGNVNTAYIKIIYDSANILPSIDEQNLRMYKYDGVKWQICKDPVTGMDTGVDIASSVVWAKVNGFSIFTAADSSSIDSDGDGLPDLWESYSGLNPNSADDASADPDGDLLINSREAIYNTNATNPDTDNDGFKDGIEVDGFWLFSRIRMDDKFFSQTSETYINISKYPVNHTYCVWFNGTAMVNQTTVNLLNNSLILRTVTPNETNVSNLTRSAMSCTIPAVNLSDELASINVSYFAYFQTNASTIELWLAADPVNFTNQTSFEIDISDAVVYMQGIDPNNPDTDGDGLPDLFEAMLGTAIGDKDTDGDSIWDGAEVVYWHTMERIGWQDTGNRASIADFDNDSLPDGQEILLNTPPAIADFDQDGLTDYQEAGQFVPMIRYSSLPSPVTFNVTKEGEYSIKMTARDSVTNYDATSYQSTICKGKYIATNNQPKVQAEYVANAIAPSNVIQLYKVMMNGSNILMSNNYQGSSCSVLSSNMTNINSVSINDTRYFIDTFSLTPGTYSLSINTASSVMSVTPISLVISKRWLDPFNPDVDGDGLFDGAETKWGADPWNVDSDGDGLWDGCNPNNISSREDVNGNGILDYGETDPTKVDTDSDGLWDGMNVTINNQFHTGEQSIGTCPWNPDTDGDGLNDGYENNTIYAGGLRTDPLKWDTDSDTIPDGWEVQYGLNPTNPADANQNSDTDSLTNAQEYTVGTNATKADTDNDSLSDSSEISGVRLRTNATDGATSSNGYENTTWLNVNIGTPLWASNYSYGLQYSNFSSQFNGSADSTQTIELKAFNDGGAVLVRWEPSGSIVAHINQTSMSTNITFGGDDSVCQSFNISQNNTIISQVGVWVSRANTSVTGNLTLEIREDNLNKPSDKILSSAKIDATNLTTSQVNISISPLLLIPKQTYWLVLSAPDAGAGNLTLQTANETSYGYGEARIRHGPSTWWNPIKKDLAFTVKGYSNVTYPNAFIWKAGSQRSGNLSGICIQYNRTGNASGMSAPAIGFHGREIYIGSDPTKNDTDADGLKDGYEVLTLGTDPASPDTDRDGVKDGREVELGANPLNLDSDGDGIKDGIESLGDQDIDYDGLIGMLDVDSDGDGLHDGPSGTGFLGEDLNGNGIVETGETNLISADSDSDGITDWDEQCNPYVQPFNDTDKDGLINALDTDSDGDGISDGNEVRALFRTNAINGVYNNTSWIAAVKNITAWGSSPSPLLNWTLSPYSYLDASDGGCAGSNPEGYITPGNREQPLIRSSAIQSASALDGEIDSTGNYSNAINGTSVVAYTTWQDIAIGQRYIATNYYAIYRGYLSFDTTSITGTPTAAYLNITINATDSRIPTGGLDIKCYIGNYGATLTASDWNANTSYLENVFHVNPTSIDINLTLTINPMHINKSGRTQFIFKTSEEGTPPPTGGWRDICIYSSDAPGTVRPTLSVYSLGINSSQPIYIRGSDVYLLDPKSATWAHFHENSTNLNATNSSFPISSYSQNIQEKVAFINVGEDSLPNVLDNDSDNDGIQDGTEDNNGNGLPDIGETNLFVNDTDGDGILDGTEITNMTNPLLKDTDADGLWDGDELNITEKDGYTNIYVTNPLNPDSDGDGLWDGYNISDSVLGNHAGELNVGTCPTDKDTDDDGLWDGYSIYINGTLHLGEMSIGTSPLCNDSDGDNLTDGLEVGLYYYDDNNTNIVSNQMAAPLKATNLTYFHSDADPNTTTNPMNPDTDADGIPDGWIDGWYNGTWHNGSRDNISQPWEGEDLNLNGAVDSYMGMPETTPTSLDSDRDGLNDTEERGNNTYWFNCNGNSSVSITVPGAKGNYSIMAFVNATSAGALTVTSLSIPAIPAIPISSGARWVIINQSINLTGMWVNLSAPSGAGILWILVAPAWQQNTTTVQNLSLNGTINFTIPSGYYVQNAMIDIVPVSRNDGAISGAMWSVGKVGNALSFDGVNDYMMSSNSASLNNTNGFSVEAWIKPNAVGSGYMLLGNHVDNFEFDLRYGISLYVRDAAGWDLPAQSGLGTIPIGVWTHVVGTFDKLTIKVYVNSVLRNTTSRATTLVAGDFGLTIGTYDGAPPNGWYFNGLIDEVRVLNRALTQEEITGDFNATGRYPVRMNTTAWYTFDEFNRSSPSTIYDLSGFNNLGTAYGASRVSVDGSALSFNGSDDYVDIGNNPSLDVGNGDFSVEAWIKYSTTTGEARSIIEISGFSNDFMLGTGLVNNQGTVSFGINGIWYYNAGSGLNDNNWHHVVGTKTGSTVKIYVDGTSKTYLQGTLTHSGFNRIGYGYHGKFSGCIDELRIFNRSLSLDEIKEDFNATGNYPIRTSTVAWYHFDEATGSVAHDSNFVQDLSFSLGNSTVPVWSNPGALTQPLTIPFMEDFFNQQIYATGNVSITFNSTYGGCLGWANVSLVLAPLATNPTSNDTDLDQLHDWYEVRFYGTNPLSEDTDHDMLNDYEEIMNATGTNPAMRDTDHDGLWDGFHDLDGDGLYDPCSEVGEDTNVNYQVDWNETHPLDPDNDNDGLIDGVERIPGVMWFEAENYSANVSYDPSAKGNWTVAGNLSVTALGAGQLLPVLENGIWKIYVRVRGNYSNRVSDSLLYDDFTAGLTGWSTYSEAYSADDVPPTNTLMNAHPEPPVVNTPPFPSTRYGDDAANLAPATILITAWIDGVEYGQATSGADGIYLINTLADDGMTGVVKDGGWNGETIYYVLGGRLTMTSPGNFAAQTNNFISGQNLEGPLSHATTQPVLLKINNITLASGANSGIQFIRLYNPSASPVNLTNYSVGVNHGSPGTWATITAATTLDSNGQSQPNIPAYGYAWINMTALGITLWTNDAVKLKHTPTEFIIDRVEYGVINMLPDETNMPNAPSPGTGQEIRRRTPGQDTNDCNQDFTIVTYRWSVYGVASVSYGALFCTNGSWANHVLGQQPPPLGQKPWLIGRQPSRDDYIISFDYFWPIATPMNNYQVFASWDGTEFDDVHIVQTADKLYANNESAPFVTLSVDFWHHFDLYVVSDGTYRIYLDERLVKSGNQIGSGRITSIGYLGDISTDPTYYGSAYWDNFKIVESESINITILDATGTAIGWKVESLKMDYEWISGPTLNLSSGHYGLRIEGVSAGAIYVDRWMLSTASNSTMISDPLTYDTDADGLSDGDERGPFHVNPMIRDTDNDGLLDGIEAMPKVGTDPWNNDTEYDYLVDGDGAEIGVIFRTNATSDATGNLTYGSGTWIALPELTLDTSIYSETFSGGMGSWTVPVGGGSWSISSERLYQSDSTNNNTNAYTALYQSGALNYTWTMQLVDFDGWAVGLHFMASDGASSYRGNSYLVWHTGSNYVYLYKSSADVLQTLATVITPLKALNFYTVNYNSISGLIEIYVNGALKINYTDPNPLTEGSYISFRTNAARAYFDDLTITSKQWLPSRMSNSLENVFVYDVSLPTGSAISGYGIPYTTPDGKSIIYNQPAGYLYIRLLNGTFARYTSSPNLSNVEKSSRPLLPFALACQEVYRNAAKTADADGDGMIDGLESAYWCSSRDRDSDDDGLPDGYELYVLGTNPGNPDSDGDGVQDGTECGITSADVLSGYWNSDVNMFIYGTDFSVFVPDADPTKTTNPTLKDTDGDGLWDGWQGADWNPGNGEDRLTISAKEHYYDATTRLWADGKVDTWNNRSSLNQSESDPSNPDSDGDGLKDGVDPAKRDCDADDDGLWDGPNVGNYTGEMTYGTSATLWDSDSDLLPDCLEVSLEASKVKLNSEEIRGYTIWYTFVFTQDADLTTHTNPRSADTDGDGLSDSVEERITVNGMRETGETDPNNPDTDGDGVKDGSEIDWNLNTDGEDGINALDKDSDGDGLEDGYEVNYLDGGNAQMDSDSDGKKNMVDSDADNDTISDGMEVNTYHTNSRSNDTDGDGINDSAELLWGSDPRVDDRNVDSDGDGLNNMVEVQYNIQHTVKVFDATKWDSDGDGINDKMEYDFNATHTGANQLDPIPGAGDYDNDGLNNTQEIAQYGTDWTNPDTDNDNLKDGIEIAMGTDPKFNDTDRDMILDGNEPKVVYRTNAIDTDGDGVPNYAGAWVHLDTNWTNSIWELWNYTGATITMTVWGNITGTEIGSTPEGYNITISGTSMSIWIKQTTNYTTGEYNLTRALFPTKSTSALAGDLAPRLPYAVHSQEVYGGLSPTNNDTDGDGLYDGANVTWQYTLDKKDHQGEDWNGNGIYDVGLELNPLNPDTDGDSANDGQELFGYNLVWMSASADGTVTQHYVNGTTSNPLDATNGWRDLDGDGITDYNETHYDTVFKEIKDWANLKKAETGGEFNSTEYLDKQFNPFVRENTPPLIQDVSINTVEHWHNVYILGIPVKISDGWFAEINLYVTDVAGFTVVFKQKDSGETQTFTGAAGKQHFYTAMGLDYWTDVLFDYKINATCTDTSGNQAFYEQKVNGLFGGFMDFLSMIWNAMVGAFSAAWEAVKAALDFLVDIITSILMAVLKPLWEALNATISNFFESMKALQNDLFLPHSPPYYETNPEEAARKYIFGIMASQLCVMLLAIGETFEYLEPIGNSMLFPIGSIIIGTASVWLIYSLITIAESLSVVLPESQKNSTYADMIYVGDIAGAIMSAQAPVFFSAILALVTGASTFSPSMKSGVLVKAMASIFLILLAIFNKYVLKSDILAAGCFIAAWAMFSLATHALFTGLTSATISPVWTTVKFIIWSMNIYYLYIGTLRLGG